MPAGGTATDQDEGRPGAPSDPGLEVQPDVAALPDDGRGPMPSGAMDPDPESTGREIDELLNEVERALERLDDGTYGTCATCGERMADERLAEDPTAQRCAECPAP